MREPTEAERLFEDWLATTGLVTESVSVVELCKRAYLAAFAAGRLKGLEEAMTLWKQPWNGKPFIENLQGLAQQQREGR